MEDLILQGIFLPVTIAMFGLEVLGKAINDQLPVETTVTVAGAPPQQSAPSAATAPPAPAAPPASSVGGSQPGADIKVVSYHPYAAKGCCQG